ncbi:MAG: hypothetical protein IPN22_14170 [Bacteroidetes bacterium]|nr:hypothetical protein [Bacteroidota bacterium]
MQESFAYIVQLVEDKWTISEAVDLANVCKTAFYKYITPEQKARLWEIKTAHTSGMAAFIKSVTKPKPGTQTPLTKPPAEDEEDDDSFDDWIEPSLNPDWDF